MSTKWRKDHRGTFIVERKVKSTRLWVTVENHHDEHGWYIAGHASNGRLVHHTGAEPCPPPNGDEPNVVWSIAIEPMMSRALKGLTLEVVLDKAKPRRRKKKKTIKRTRINRK